MGRWDDRICIILVNWNGKRDTIECLHSLAKCTYPKFTAIVVDNGSTDGSVPAIRAVHPTVPIFETRENLGFAGGNNIGIEWALRKPFDWILLLNNDTTVASDFLEAFLEAAKKQPKGKIFGAKILRYSEPHKIDHLGGKWDPSLAEFISLYFGEDDRETIEGEQADYVCGAALFMHRSVPETIGLLEPHFFLFWEETDYCFRARRKGFEVWTAPKARIWHKVSSSFTGGKPHTHYFWWRSRLLWIERNLPYGERREILSKVVYPTILKSIRHFVFKGGEKLLRRILFLPSNPTLDHKVRRLRAGLMGAVDYFRGRFGNCPKWVIK